MTIKELNQHKKVYILGYGIEGKSVHEFMKKFCPHVEIGIGDAKLDPNYLDKQLEYDLVIKSPGIRCDMVRGTYTTPTNIFFANTPHITIGITGTKGKSTTSTLTNQLLQKAGKKSVVAGNIGMPMLDILTEGVDDDTYVVLELSSYQLEDIAHAPHISIILNIYEELHNHKTFVEYRRAKFMIAQSAHEDDMLVYNPELPELDELLLSTSAKKIPFIQDIGSYRYSRSLNGDTVKALLTLANILDFESDIVQKTLDSYIALPHRMQDVGTYAGIRFINDSAANHPMATVHALKNTENVRTIILGGQDRGFNFEEVATGLKDAGVETVILFPDTQEKISRAIESVHAYNPSIYYTDSMKEAVSLAFTHTPSGSTCLMSPGAPSYLMFAHFPARGESFVQEISAYAKKNSSNNT